MVSFENFVKSVPPSLSELKVKPSFCFPIKIRDDPTASIAEGVLFAPLLLQRLESAALPSGHEPLYSSIHIRPFFLPKSLFSMQLNQVPILQLQGLV